MLAFPCVFLITTIKAHRCRLSWSTSELMWERFRAYLGAGPCLGPGTLDVSPLHVFPLSGPGPMPWPRSSSAAAGDRVPPKTGLVVLLKQALATGPNFFFFFHENIHVGKINELESLPILVLIHWVILEHEISLLALSSFPAPLPQQSLPCVFSSTAPAPQPGIKYVNCKNWGQCC